jgi:hypothetical protein
MHDIVEHFVGRYQVWRDQPPARNPLNIPALVVAAAIVESIYQIVRLHHVTWLAAVVTLIDMAFLVLYFTRSSWAWLVLPLWGTLLLLELPFMAVSAFQRYPLRITIISTCFALVMGFGFIAWGFAIRRRYHRYIGYVPEHAHS